MISEEELNEYRTTVQQIIDKHLPEDKRFSVQNFSLEWLQDLASLLLEKDEGKRDKIWAQIKEKRDKAIERFKKAEYEFLQEDAEIENKIEEYKNIFNSLDELNWLEEDINTDKELDKELDNILQS